jgi:hypothetical protein
VRRGGGERRGEAEARGDARRGDADAMRRDATRCEGYEMQRETMRWRSGGEHAHQRLLDELVCVVYGCRIATVGKLAVEQRPVEGEGRDEGGGAVAAESRHKVEQCGGTV